jgi:polygalacturonase
MNIRFWFEACVFAICLLPACAEAAVHEVKEPTSKAIQSAIDICAAAGGGVVDLPAGRYVTGPLWLKENVELRLEAGATVVLSPNKADWPAGIRAMINAKGVKHIAVTGRGTFDGDAQWEYAPVRGQDPEIADEQENARRAGVEMKRYYRKGDVRKYLFVLQECEDVHLEGVTIRNAPLWNVRLQDCNRSGSEASSCILTWSEALTPTESILSQRQMS